VALWLSGETGGVGLDILKGNYELPDAPQREAETTGTSLTEAFEAATLAKVGGSICFVMKSDAFLW